MHALLKFLANLQYISIRRSDQGVSRQFLTGALAPAIRAGLLDRPQNRELLMIAKRGDERQARALLAVADAAWRPESRLK